MSSADWYAEAKSWQTAIGAVLGFVALFVGALWNYHLNRRRDYRVRNQEALSVAVALYGEVLLLRDHVVRAARTIAFRFMETGGHGNMRIDKDFVEANKVPDALIYEALAGKLGLLDAKLVLQITSFHRHVHEFRTYMPRLVEDKDRGYYYSVNYALDPAHDAVVDVEPALRRIEAMAAIREAAPAPDLKVIRDAIELERDMHTGD